MSAEHQQYLRKAMYFTFGFKLFLVVFGNLMPGGWNGWQHILDVLARNDSGWYHQIAREGYPTSPSQPGEQTAFPFFPLYPFLLGGFLKITGDYITAALIFHLILTVLWVLVLYRYLQSKAIAAERIFAFIVLYQAFPFHYVFHAFYSEQLFSILLVWSLLEIEKKRWKILFISTFLLAICRPAGLMMAAGMALLIAENAGWWKIRKNTKSLLLIVALSGAIFSVITWSVYLWFRCGDAFAFSHAQGAWGRHYTWPWEPIFINGKWEVQLLSAYICVLLLLTIFAIRKAKTGNKIFVGLNALFPLATGSIVSYPRIFSVIIIAFESILPVFFKNWKIWAAILMAVNLFTFYYWVSYSGWLSF